MSTATAAKREKVRTAGIVDKVPKRVRKAQSHQLSQHRKLRTAYDNLTYRACRDSRRMP